LPPCNILVYPPAGHVDGRARPELADQGEDHEDVEVFLEAFISLPFWRSVAMVPFVLSLLPFVIVAVIFLSAAYVTPTAADLLDLTAVLATAPWMGMKLHLCTTNFTPTKTNVLADFTPGEATFVGYSAQTITFGTPYIDASGNAVATALVSFSSTANTTPNTLYTCYATNTAGSTLQFSARLDNAPIAIVETGDGISLAITVNLADGTIVVVG
jgi:hypothetical protein